ncbi:hypothetical protein HYU92_02650 [Candidatus Curtissbacteria bacterium]|nr:hypothetical protein [Candidatus Curtissbacteria bacterium]
MKYKFTALTLFVVLLLGIALEFSESKEHFNTDRISIIPLKLEIPKQPHEPVQQYPITQIRLSGMANIGTSSINPTRINSSGTNLT